jgi:integration host factor subunit alpha
MTLTKNNLIESVQNNLDLSKQRSTKLVESTLEIIKDTLAGGDDVLISGFGKFSVRDKERRRGRNPQTGSDLILRSRRVITFRCSQVLRDKLNPSV